MLCVTRKKQESIIIEAKGIKIEVAVLKWDHSRVAIGIDAPDEVTILRKELVNEQQ